jgi:hypothetical protein
MYHISIVIYIFFQSNRAAHYFVFVVFQIWKKKKNSGGLLVSEIIICPVVSVSALTWFIRYMYHWNLQFLNNVIIIKTKVLLPRHEWP